MHRFSTTLFLVVLASGCGAASESACDTCTVVRGTERHDCLVDGGCNAGLMCLSNLCVRPADAGTAPFDDALAVATEGPLAFDASPPDVLALDASVAETAVTDAPIADATVVQPDALTSDAARFVTNDAPAVDASVADTRTDGALVRDAPVATDVVVRFNDAGLACPGAEIWHPGTESRHLGSSVPFIGHAQSADCTALTGSALAWTDNLEGAIGTGASFSHAFTTLGSHTVTLTASYGAASTETATLSFAIIP